MFVNKFEMRICKHVSKALPVVFVDRSELRSILVDICKQFKYYELVVFVNVRRDILVNMFMDSHSRGLCTYVDHHTVLCYNSLHYNSGYRRQYHVVQRLPGTPETNLSGPYNNSLLDHGIHVLSNYQTFRRSVYVVCFLIFEKTVLLNIVIVV